MIINIAGKNFAIGLWWQIYPKNIKVVKNEIKKINATLEEQEEKNIYNFYANYEIENEFLVGLYPGEKGNKLKKKTYPLGFVFLGKEESFLGKFKLSEDTYWLIAIYNGLILPEGDIFGDKATIEEKFNELSSFAEWKVVKDFDTEEQSYSFLSDYIENFSYSNKFSLQNVYFSLPDKKYIYLSILLIGTFAGYLTWNSYQEKKRQEQLQLMMQQQQILEQQKKQVQKKPWLDELNPGQMVYFCYSGVYGVPFYQKGWNLEKIICSKERISLYWKRKDGNFKDLPDRAVFNPVKPNLAVSYVKPNFSPIKRTDENILLDKELARALYEFARKLNMPIKINWNVQSFRNVNIQQPNSNNQMLIPRYKKIGWELETQFYNHLKIIGDFLKNLPGVVVNNIVYNNLTNKWKIKGEAYVKN